MEVLTLKVGYTDSLIAFNVGIDKFKRPKGNCGIKEITFNWISSRCGSRIWSRGGPQVLRPKVADIAKRSCASEASNLRPGSRACLRALEAFGFLMLKYAFSHILETLFL